MDAHRGTADDSPESMLMNFTIDPKTLAGNWNYPTPIRFGPGRIRELAQTCLEFGIRRPLLVTDPGLAAMPMVADAAQSCRDAGLACEVFADVRGNPVESNVVEGVRAWRDGGHDGVIGFGGGSALDAAKAVALMSGQNRPIWDFEDREDWWTRADAGGIAPVVAVPTTSGTGSEVGRASVITDVRDHTKKIIFHPKMLPVVVIADPELTVGLPAPITAAVGMDALSHNLEAFCSPVFHPMAQGIALRRDPASEGVAPGGLRERHGHRRPRLHAGGLHDGSDRVPEGTGRDALDEPSVRRRLPTRTMGSPTQW